MRATLISKNRIPYNSLWRYVDPYTKMEISAVTWDNLMAKIYEHRRANGNPIGLGLEDEVEDYVCQHQPDECENLDPKIPRRRNLTLSDVVRGTAVMMSFKFNGSQLVPREEAERRAQICVDCIWNQTFAKPCSGICQELHDIVSVVTQHQGTQYDSKLHSCGICGCFLQAAVWLRLEDQCLGVSEGMREQFKGVSNCWKTCD